MASVPMVPVQHRLRHFFLNAIAFNCLYLLSNAHALQQGVQRHAAMAWEEQIPFLPWMIVPYLSSGLFFCLGFAWVQTGDQLRVLSQRLLLATMAAALVFYVYPLQFSWPRPAVTLAPLAAMFDVLSVVDKPYNQLPSLHVAFCLIFWISLRRLVASPWAKTLLAGWLLLTAMATVFTYQHHVLDVVGGLALGGVCLLAVRPGRSEPDVAFYYFTASATVLLVLVLLARQTWAVYGVVSLFLVGLAYARQDRFFLRKHHGRFPVRTWLLFGPYLLGYWLTWQAVRRRERLRPVVQQLTAQLWIGRRLHATEVGLLPADCSVVDVSNELSETTALRERRYQHMPLLDLLTPPADASRQIVAALAAEIRAGRVVYLHCSMGYSRCKQMAAAYLAQHAP